MRISGVRRTNNESRITFPAREIWRGFLFGKQLDWLKKLEKLSVKTPLCFNVFLLSCFNEH
jgi:hypothetical protein